MRVLNFSDHNYDKPHSQKKRQNDIEDHEYACTLHGETSEEEESEDDDMDGEDESLLAKMASLLPTPALSLQYHSPSVLKGMSIQDLTSKDVFLQILEEMKSR